jgi:hypothetical protein
MQFMLASFVLKTFVRMQFKLANFVLTDFLRMQFVFVGFVLRTMQVKPSSSSNSIQNRICMYICKNKLSLNNIRFVS